MGAIVYRKLPVEGMMLESFDDGTNVYRLQDGKWVFIKRNGYNAEYYRGSGWGVEVSKDEAFADLDKLDAVKYKPAKKASPPVADSPSVE